MFCSRRFSSEIEITTNGRICSQEIVQTCLLLESERLPILLLFSFFQTEFWLRPTFLSPLSMIHISPSFSLSSRLRVCGESRSVAVLPVSVLTVTWEYGLQKLHLAMRSWSSCFPCGFKCRALTGVWKWPCLKSIKGLTDLHPK